MWKEGAASAPDTAVKLSVSDLQTIFEFYENLFVNPMTDYCNKKVRLRVPLIPIPVMQNIIKESIEVFKREPTILQLVSPIQIVGDLHGHLPDLLRILQNYGTPKTHKFLFLGNIVNKGEFSLETISLVLIMKLLWPANVSIIRGPNEFREVCQTQGFLNELEMMYEDKGLFMPFMQLFAHLPLAASIDRKIICFNGGFGPNITDLNVIASIKRPVHSFNSPVMVELFWSDPTDALPMFLPSTRGFGNLYGVEAVTQFLKTIKYTLIVRGHQLVENGCKPMFNDQLITIFSASRFCNQGNNKSGLLIINGEQSNCITSEPLGYLTRPDVMFTPSESETSFILPTQISFMNSQSSIKKFSQQTSSTRLPLQNGFRISTMKASSINIDAPSKPARMLKPIGKTRMSSTQRTVSKMVLNF